MYLLCVFMLAKRVTEIIWSFHVLSFPQLWRKKRYFFCYVKLCNIRHVLWRRNFLCTSMFSLCMPCMLQLCFGVGRMAERRMQCMLTLCPLSYSAPLQNIKSKKLFWMWAFIFSPRKSVYYVHLGRTVLCRATARCHSGNVTGSHSTDLPVDSDRLSK